MTKTSISIKSKGDSTLKTVTIMKNKYSHHPSWQQLITITITKMKKKGKGNHELMSIFKT